MSIPLALIGQSAPESAYVVAAPRRCDAIAATLRSVYTQAADNTEMFGDMLAILDTMEARPPRR